MLFDLWKDTLHRFQWRAIKRLLCFVPWKGSECRIPDDFSRGYNCLHCVCAFCLHCASTARLHLTATIEQKVQRTFPMLTKRGHVHYLAIVQRSAVWGGYGVVCGIADSFWNVMAQGDAREGKWRGNWRMEWVASTLHTTSEHGVSSFTTAGAHTSAASSRLNWRHRRFNL